MNIKELEKLTVLYDDENNCWAITNDTEYVISDMDIAEELGLSLRQYFDMLISNGGYDVYNQQDCVGFKTKEIAEQCLEVIKNYKDDDIIEKVDVRIIPKMNVDEFDKKSNGILTQMREEYSNITLSDLQTVGMFCKMFKEKYIKVEEI
jgi:hypothetical protein